MPSPVKSRSRRPAQPPYEGIRRWPLHEAARVIKSGGIIAYPTEGIYGLGCDPRNGDAVYRLLHLKHRSVRQGLILVASDFQQLESYLAPLSRELKGRVMHTWPGPVTWVLPCRKDIPVWIRGEHHSLAVRISAHPVITGLCREISHPLISTSANISGQSPAYNPLAVRRIFRDRLDYILHGPLGGTGQATEIRDGCTGKILRAAKARSSTLK